MIVTTYNGGALTVKEGFGFWACGRCPNGTGWAKVEDPTRARPDEELAAFLRWMSVHHDAQGHYTRGRALLLWIAEAFALLGLHDIGVWFVRQGVRA